MVVLTYFSITGKYHTNSAYISEMEDDIKIYNEVMKMWRDNKLPGINIPELWQGYCLIDPERGIRYLLDLTKEN